VICPKNKTNTNTDCIYTFAYASCNEIPKVKKPSAWNSPAKISLNSEFFPIPNFVQFRILSNTIQNSAQKNKCTNSGSISGNEQTKRGTKKKFKQIHNVYKLRACGSPPKKWTFYKAQNHDKHMKILGATENF